MESSDDNKQQIPTLNCILEENEPPTGAEISTSGEDRVVRSEEDLKRIEELRETLTKALSASDISSSVNDKVLSKSETEVPKSTGQLKNTHGPDNSTAGGDNESSQQNYIPPLENPYEKAWKFLSKHDILTLFQGLTANIVAKRPECPLDFMIEEIEKLQEQDRIRKGVIKQTQPQVNTQKDNSES